MMRRLRKLLGLPAAERRLLLKTWVLVCLVRLGLTTLSFNRLQRLLERVGPGSRRQPVDLKQIAWAVTTASRYVPRSNTCLTQALTARILLVRSGYPATLRIGARFDADKRLEFHAWVESDGVVVVGGREVESYAVLSPPGDGPNASGRIRPPGFVLENEPDPRSSSEAAR